MKHWYVFKNGKCEFVYHSEFHARRRFKMEALKIDPDQDHLELMDDCGHVLEDL